MVHLIIRPQNYEDFFVFDGNWRSLREDVAESFASLGFHSYCYLKDNEGEYAQFAFQLDPEVNIDELIMLKLRHA